MRNYIPHVYEHVIMYLDAQIPMVKHTVFHSIIFPILQNDQNTGSSADTMIIFK